MVRSTSPLLKMRATARACAAVLVLVSTSTLAFGAEDSVAGQHVFAVRCAACHGTTVGEKKVGPSLAGVVGHASGSVPDFRYSPALKNAHLTWDDATLGKWLANPSGLVHGTTMFVNVPSDADRQNLIAYLKTLSAGPNATPATAH